MDDHVALAHGFLHIPHAETVLRQQQGIAGLDADGLAAVRGEGAAALQEVAELLLDDLVDLWTREGFSACYVTHNLAEAVRLGHRIVVLSRRPGTIRDVVDVDIPLAERAERTAELAPIERRLWLLMREEARAADRELIGA